MKAYPFFDCHVPSDVDNERPRAVTYTRRLITGQYVLKFSVTADRWLLFGEH